MEPHRRDTEGGWLLVTSVMVLMTMLTIALVSFTLVDRGQQHSLDQRQRESALNLAEGVLYSQAFALAQQWPGNAAAESGVPTTCTEVTAATVLCPRPSTLAGAQGAPATANFVNSDSLTNVTWTTRIRDNGGGLAGAYVPGAAAEAVQTGTNIRGQAYTCAAPCRWDANGDRQLWVQARTVVQGKPRSIVALLKRERFTEPFPRNAVTAGSFETTNSGNKTIIQATGSQVVVRCESTGNSCTDYDEDKSQVLPAEIVRESETPPAMTTAQIARFKAVAQSASPSTYHTSCPASLTGTVVFIDVPAATSCQDSNNATYNSATEPGLVIMPRGKLSMKGTLHGLVYMANEQNSAAAVLTLQANSEVFGGVAIDGPGRLVAGQASGQRATVTYVSNAFNSLSSFGTAGLVQNTWRELAPN